MSDAERQLKPANQNPWYVLMTLYGEQDGEEVDWELHRKNKELWNSWACQHLDSEIREEFAKNTNQNPSDLAQWPRLKDIISIRFLDAWNARNKGKPCPPLPHPEGTIDFSDIWFVKKFVAKEFVFSGSANFNNSRFRKGVFLELAQFRSPAMLNAIQAEGWANFESVCFKSLSSFVSARFDDLVTFQKVTFHSPALLGHVEYGSDAFFSHAIFCDQAYFGYSNFGEQVRFIACTFKGHVNFIRTRFSGHVSFSNSRFEPNSTNLILNELGFEECQFFKPIVLKGAKIQSNFPNFENAQLYEGLSVSCSKCKWPEHDGCPPEKSRSSCATIRHALGNQGLPEEEHFFFRKEMYYAGRRPDLTNATIEVRVKDYWRRLPYNTFGLLSDYGYSIARPSAWLFVLWLVPFLIYMSCFEWIRTFHGGLTHVVNGKPVVFEIGTFDSVSLSFTSMFKFLGLQRLHFGADYIQALPWPLELLTAFQTLGGIILFFFLGLGLRTRFRLR